MLRSVDLKTGGKFFAMATDGDLGVKLPARRVTDLIASGAGRPSGRAHARAMRERVRLRPESRASGEAYVLDARDFAASLRATETE